MTRCARCSCMFHDNEEEEVADGSVTVAEIADLFIKDAIRDGVRTSEEPIRVILGSNFGADLCRELCLDLIQAPHVERVARQMIDKGEILAVPHTEKVSGSKGKIYTRKVSGSPYVCLISG